MPVDKNRGVRSRLGEALTKWRERLLSNADDPGFARKYSRPDPIGSALLVMFKDALLWKDDDEQLGYHAVHWEGRLVARVLRKLGFSVTAADYLRDNKSLAGRFDIALAHAGGGKDYFDGQPDECVKVLYVARENPVVSVERQNRRRLDINRRRGCSLTQAPVWAISAQALDSMIKADLCLLMGTEALRDGYPETLRPKIRLVPAVFAPVKNAKSDRYAPEPREFLWHGGLNPVHKGVDLLLDVFAKRPEWTLHLVGPIIPPNRGKKTKKLYDAAFLREYERELTALPNICAHGYIKTDSPEFLDIVKRCFCFVFPSCSEGISPACAMSMALGLYPVISKHTGVVLPEGCGRILETCSVEEIDTVLDEVRRMPEAELTRQTQACQALATATYTHEAFFDAVEKHIREALAEKRPDLASRIIPYPSATNP